MRNVDYGIAVTRKLAIRSSEGGVLEFFNRGFFPCITSESSEKADLRNNLKFSNHTIAGVANEKLDPYFSPHGN